MPCCNNGDNRTSVPSTFPICLTLPCAYASTNSPQNYFIRPSTKSSAVQEDLILETNSNWVVGVKKLNCFLTIQVVLSVLLILLFRFSIYHFRDRSGFEIQITTQEMKSAWHMSKWLLLPQSNRSVSSLAIKYQVINETLNMVVQTIP